MNLNPQDLAKVRKAALHSVTLSSEMKTAVGDARLKELTQGIKKLLLKKDTFVEVVCLKAEP